MAPDLTDTLCTRCGLCCDGTLFADVELSGRAEATRLAVLGLEVEDDESRGELLVQPCAALRGTRCSVYVHRPKCCRTFECALLQDARRGAVSPESARVHIAEALKLVRRGRALVAQLGEWDSKLPLAECAAEVLAGEVGADRTASAKRAELAATMSELAALIRKTFLRGGKAAGKAGRG
jgi:hypothetical protein